MRRQAKAILAFLLTILWAVMAASVSLADHSTKLIVATPAPGSRSAVTGHSTLVATTGLRILLIARDLEDHLLPGFHFSYQGVESQKTNRPGATELELPPGFGPGQQIKIFLVHHSKKTKEWFLVNPQINIPLGSGAAEVILMRRSTFRQIAAEALDAPGANSLRSNEQLGAENPKRALAAAATRRGLAAEQLESAIRSFSDTQDPKDRGIAAYLESQFQQAEDLLNIAVEKKERDLVETLSYLGATQYQQAKYRAAADSFRKALALRSEDPSLLSWLGESLRKLAEWVEAEPLMRRALAIDEKSYGPEHPNITADLNNLALLLKDTNHPAEAEPLMRRALAIDEKSYGPEHPSVAADLNNLAHLLEETNRLTEAEPMMRRAFAIDEKSYGPEHPNVAIRLNNLAQLLKATNRLAEAEPLMRRALSIVEKSYGPEHSDIAMCLNNLAKLLQATNRLVEAEPLMRRALAIDEKSYGPEHPNIAVRLSNLALLLKDMNRLAEAEPLMRRSLAILLNFSGRTGHEHPNQKTALNKYRELLQAMGKSQAEIEETIKTLN